MACNQITAVQILSNLKSKQQIASGMGYGTKI